MSKLEDAELEAYLRDKRQGDKDIEEYRRQIISQIDSIDTMLENYTDNMYMQQIPQPEQDETEHDVKEGLFRRIMRRFNNVFGNE